MAMQKHLSVQGCHQRSITALGFHSARREFLTGFEDGVIKWWDLDNGRLSQSAAEHAGMVTHLLYWAETKLVLSSSNDGMLIAWTAGAVVFDRIKLGSPIFSIAINIRRQLLVCGFKKHLSVYPLDERKTSGHVINLKKRFSDHRHTDIVSCVVTLDNRIYTAGYDKKFIIFDTYQTAEKTCLTAVRCNSRAHEAGIIHLLLVRESESTRFLTGSFDQTIGVWSQDGQLIQRLRHFTGVITGLCYVAPVKTVWITSGSSHPLLLDPRSGETISDFVDTFKSQEDGPQLQQLVCLPESSHVIGCSRQNHVTVWKYNKMGCVTVLHTKHPLECLSYTGTKLILLFTGDSNGTVEKWERNYISPFIYSKESYHMADTRPERKGPRCLQQVQIIEWSRRPQSRLNRVGTAGVLRKGIIANSQRTCRAPRKSCGFMKSLFIEEMDILVMSAENGDIYLWEFDDSVMCSVPEETPALDEHQELIKKYEFLLARGSESFLETQKTSGVLNKHLAGFTCKKILAAHYKAVTALALIGKESGFHTAYLLSGGWDRRLCVWDLDTCSLAEAFSNPDLDHWSEQREIACDGAILDMCYSPKRKEFAYASSDGRVYIRRFATVSSEMTLVNILIGHEAEVTSIVWHHLIDKWISGSEDGTIRIWSEDGTQCEKILVTKGVVTCICIDQVNGCIAAGVHDAVRVYDPESLLQVQCNMGHKDLIRSIVHIPEMKQVQSL
ncbi:uncharacterized protein LOC142495400 isoform X2 [Ascaphus truei]|uniref:uncharacterized protein LOC142495400 isoform X2 n=1 Tax=Ascaphus truei TaxID=8439 RepID=UPI003F5A4303